MILRIAKVGLVFGLVALLAFLLATGAQSQPSGTISGVVYADMNRNGHSDPGDLPVDGIVIYASGITATSEIDGSYALPLSSGRHWVCREKRDDAGQSSLTSCERVDAPTTHNVSIPGSWAFLPFVAE